MSAEKEGGEGKSLAELAVRRRQEIREKKDVSDAAKLLFDDLTDLCFLSKHGVGFGIVRAGKPLLAERLGKSVSTITRAQKELAASEIWTRTGWHEGHEITIWFLRGIADRQMEFDRFTEGVTKRPHTRVAPRVQAVRNGHGHFCKINGSAKSQEKDQLAVNLTGDPGQSYRGATVNPAVATPSSLTVVNRQNHRSGPVNLDRSEPSKLTGVNGHNHRAHPSNNDAGSTAGVTGYKKDKDIGNGERAAAPPPDKKFEKFLNSLDGLYPSRLIKLKTDLHRELLIAKSPEAKAEWKRRMDAVRQKLVGGPVKDEATKPGPVRVAPKPSMSTEQARRHWEKAKKNLSPALQQKAAAGTAART
jgi:hypothetical protein